MFVLGKPFQPDVQVRPIAYTRAKQLKYYQILNQAENDNEGQSFKVLFDDIWNNGKKFNILTTEFLGEGNKYLCPGEYSHVHAIKLFINTLANQSHTYFYNLWTILTKGGYIILRNADYHNLVDYSQQHYAEYEYIEFVNI